MLLVTESFVNTPDGRVLKVLEGGDTRGRPVFSLHGTPMSRFLYGPHLADASRRGIRLIGYDRPGYGGSSPHPGRKVADVAKDVAAIADSLGLDRFAVWGLSGGGPHAIACGALLPRRVVAIASMASPAPYPARGLDWLAGMGEDNVAEFGAAIAGQETLKAFLKPQHGQLAVVTADNIVKVFDNLLPPVDRAAMTGDLAEFFAAATREGLRPGYEGWMEDDLAFVSDWGFAPADVSVPVLIWQGTHDKMVPFAHGRWLAEQMPGAEVRLSSDDGHITLYQRRVSETHSWLLSHF